MLREGDEYVFAAASDFEQKSVLVRRQGVLTDELHTLAVVIERQFPPAVGCQDDETASVENPEGPSEHNQEFWQSVLWAHAFGRS